MLAKQPNPISLTTSITKPELELFDEENLCFCYLLLFLSLLGNCWTRTATKQENIMNMKEGGKVTRKSYRGVSEINWYDFETKTSGFESQFISGSDNSVRRNQKPYSGCVMNCFANIRISPAIEVNIINLAN